MGVDGDEGHVSRLGDGLPNSESDGLPTVFNATPNTLSGVPYCKGGIWMSGGAPVRSTQPGICMSSQAMEYSTERAVRRHYQRILATAI